MENKNKFGGWQDWTGRPLKVFSLCVAVLVAAIPSISNAQNFQGLGLLPGGIVSQAAGISSDGSVVVGDANSATHGPEAFRWTQGGGLITLGFLPGGTDSFANAVSSDGSVVVGLSTSASFPAFGEAFRWTQSGGMVGLGVLPGGSNSQAGSVSADGSVVVGSSSTHATTEEAFRWTQSGGMVGLGFLPGGRFSIANGVSADGSVIVGNSSVNDFLSDSQAFRWTQTGGMVGLGFLPGDIYSLATAVSADGSVIVGSSQANSSSTNGQAFRWTQSSGMVGLGTLPGGTFSQAGAVNADGSVVVGRSTSAAIPTGEAFRWTNTTGMQSLKNLLVASGVNMTGWTLSGATGISADGTVIAGYGTDPANNTEGWIARYTDNGSTTNGLITTTAVQQSFSGQSAMGETGNAALGGAFNTITSYATQTYGGPVRGSSSYSGFAYGGYDSDPTASGTLGIVHDLPDAMLVGVALGANYIKTDMIFDGSAKFGAGTGGAFVARLPQSGLQWLVGVGGIASSGDVRRGYLNGSGLASSDGHTSANGYGGTARIGWTFDSMFARTKLTPFASYSVTTLHTNSYTESDGPFPAQFNGFNDTAQISRVGADARYTLATGEWIWGTLDWAHRFDGGSNATIAGSLIGLFALSTPGSAVTQNWAELTAGFRMPVWKTAALTASVTASIPGDSKTTYQGLLGVTERF